MLRARVVVDELQVQGPRGQRLPRLEEQRLVRRGEDREHVRHLTSHRLNQLASSIAAIGVI